MDAPDDRKEFSRNPTIDDLVKLCHALNEAFVRYVVIGGFAVAHHGYLRATGDIDLLVGKACDITLDQVRDIDFAEIRGVKIPFAGIQSLMKMKRSSRPKDIMDRAFLEEKLKQLENKKS